MPGPARTHDAVVIGGGFYGCVVALTLRRAGVERVTLLEAGDDILGRASFANQARVHGGYHYPRSLLTGLRSRANYSRFTDEYRECIAGSFEKYYAIARRGSNVTAVQFRRFCERIEAPLESAPPAVRRLFNRELIEDVFLVQEAAFDAVKLRDRLRDELAASGVDVRLRTEATRVTSRDGVIDVRCATEAGDETLATGRVLNCTYARINRLLVDSGLTPIQLRHEVTELALVRMPPSLASIGITVMCGPFFSVMPFPARGLHSMSHVRYTPHFAWRDDPSVPYRDPYKVLAEANKVSSFSRMLRDAQRFVPALADCEYESSLWEVKTVLPRSDDDDSRPVLFREDERAGGLVSIMGAKIDNVYDLLEFPVMAGALAKAAP